MSECHSENILYSQLKSLVDAQNNKEHQCRRYLQHVPHILFKETVTRYVYHETEYQGHSGPSDYVISGVVLEPNGIECTRAYIWELKAPQCFIFKKETKNRICPSADLIKAENQLLHYFFELKGTDSFRNSFGVTDPDNVCLGGIIIGCKKTMVSGNYEEPKKKILYKNAIKTRNHLYKGAGIRLMTWDYVLSQFRSFRASAASREYSPQVIETPSIPSGTISIFHEGSGAFQQEHSA